MIRVRSLRFSYKANTPALLDVDLEIAPGERLAVIGANGSGKTTLARCLNGLHLPDSGEVEVDGRSTRDPESLFEIRRLVGMVFQNPDDQLVSTTVETEIAFGLENLAVPAAVMRERVEEALTAFHLTEYRRHPPHRLSGGEKQRVAVAAAVALRPRYLVLDEPTALLDPTGRREVNELLRTLHDRSGVATIHITHSPEEAMAADRVIVMDQGRVLQDAPPEVLFAEPEPLLALGLGIPFASALVAGLRRGGVAVPVGAPPADLESLAAAVAAAVGPGRISRWQPPAAPAPTPAKLSTQGLTYVYDEGWPTAHPGLDRADLEVPTNGVLALIGPSGSGKTTLAQHLNGLLKPSAGRVLLDGIDLWSLPLPRVRQRVGLVFQFPELQLFEETVALDVAFGPRNLGFDPARIETLVTRALETVGLPPDRFADRPPLSLSGGEKRRVALAGVLAMDPEVLVLDEPTAGLDPGAARALATVFHRLQEGGTTLVLITHDLELVAGLATHVAVLHQGRVQQNGPMRQVLADPDFAEVSGLEPPAPVRLARALASRGLAVPPDAVTLDELVEALTAGRKDEETRG